MRTSAQRWLTGLLAIVLAGSSGYAVLGSREQADIVALNVADSDHTDAYQQLAYLTAWEMSLIQAILREPDGEERDQWHAVHQQTRAAMIHMAEIDSEHASRAADIAARHNRLRTQVIRYLQRLDSADTDGAEKLLEEAIEPAATTILADVLAEQRQHLADHTARQEAGQRQSQRLLWGNALTFVVTLITLMLFGWAMRAYRLRLATMATTDPLTGLPNRGAFTAVMQRALAEDTRHRRGNGVRPGRATILTVNLDGFRDVNEQLGHRIGDLLLVQAGQRLRASVREHDVVARLGGDEFAVLLRDTDPAIGESIGARLAASFEHPFVIDDLTIDLEISVGAATARAGDTVATLLQHADTAMNVAKQRRLGFRRHTPQHNQDSTARLALLGDLRRAMDTGAEISLHYQPQIALRTGALAGVEALARWRHPTKGPISPGEFVPVLESTALIHRFTDQVLTMALDQARAWLDAGHRIPVSVNVSTRTLLDAGFPARVAAQLERSGIAGDQLCVEVTEHSIMSDPDTAIDALQRIRSLGVKTSIDDYGTGYSSMTYLRLLPLDELKIDRSFVDGMAHDPGNQALVASTVELGHNLGLSVVAEGVEDADTVAALRAVGCDIAQGYYFARPMTADALTESLTGAKAVAA
ncbi:bifunctional diguanylate cyclase/phosphodiesterase [Actinoplanes sp. NPDC049802]|uniref:putative bifunctional diguanylate cyclase/phosphodiesterase n=1 Tax=Actinoplanes sp. NPDC049802 TaxID=3154742 RepID=UPI00340CEA55